MGAETSIVIKATDRYSDTVKRMCETTRSFSKDVDSLEEGLYSLSKNKYTLKVDVRKAKDELRAAEKQFSKTHSEADGLRMELAQANYDNTVRNLKAVSNAAKQTESEIAKLSNRASGGIFSRIGLDDGSELGKGLANSGLLKMVGSSASGFAGALIESAIGQPSAMFMSSIASGVAAGASAGAILGPAGALIGAGIGAVSGGINGYTQIYEAKDEAFKGYVQNAVEGQLEAQNKSLTDGSALAAARETDQISFATLFKSEDKARTYLADLVQMANTTPFLYDDLTSMSKTLATYGYDETSILPVLQTIGDTGAALGQNTADMTAVATALGRMKSSNKTTREYLNILNDRGIGAVGMLADAYGVDQGTMYDMISKGKVAGQDAVKIILDALTESFAGSMELQAQTFSGITSTVYGLRQELDNAMGEGYNDERMSGLQAERDFLEGEEGQRLKDANRAMGAWKASLENKKDEYIRKAQADVMALDEYKEAEAAGDAEKMGFMLAKAKIDGMNQYNANEGKQELIAQELSLIEAVRNDTASNDAYWDAGYAKGLEYSKGRAAGMMGSGNGETSASASPSRMLQGVTLPSNGSYAVGIDYVPYDNFPALLHQGERVQTAEEARSGGSGTSIQIVMNGTVIREDADVERVASALLERMELAGMRG